MAAHEADRNPDFRFWKWDYIRLNVNHFEYVLGSLAGRKYVLFNNAVFAHI